MPQSQTPRVLFLCLGNICRSPLAEGLWRRELIARGHNPAELDELTDSAGTGDWHIGEQADPRTLANAAHNGIQLGGHRARQIAPEDFARYDLILAMDESNLHNAEAFAPTQEGSGKGEGINKARLQLIRTFDPEPGDGNVPDPWFGGAEGFERVYHILDRSIRSLAARLLDKPGASPGSA